PSFFSLTASIALVSTSFGHNRRNRSALAYTSALTTWPLTTMAKPITSLALSSRAGWSFFTQLATDSWSFLCSSVSCRLVIERPSWTSLFRAAFTFSWAPCTSTHPRRWLCAPRHAYFRSLPAGALPLRLKAAGLSPPRCDQRPCSTQNELIGSLPDWG